MYTATELFPNPTVTAAVHDYCISHSHPLPPHIGAHRERTIKWAQEQGANPAMMVSPLQSQWMMWLIKVLGVRTVLEIGCFTGYSALAFASALSHTPKSEVTTLDLPGPHTELARLVFTSSPSSTPINLLEAPASESLSHLASLGKKYDLIFLDANKNGYLSYFKQIMDLGLLSPKGILIADNALWNGLVADRSENNPASGLRKKEEADHDDEGKDTEKVVADVRLAELLDEFNKAIRADERVECVVMPVFDGLNLIRLKEGA